MKKTYKVDLLEEDGEAFEVDNMETGSSIAVAIEAFEVVTMRLTV